MPSVSLCLLHEDSIYASVFYPRRLEHHRSGNYTNEYTSATGFMGYHTWARGPNDREFRNNKKCQAGTETLQNKPRMSVCSARRLNEDGWGARLSSCSAARQCCLYLGLSKSVVIYDMTAVSAGRISVCVWHTAGTLFQTPGFDKSLFREIANCDLHFRSRR